MRHIPRFYVSYFNCNNDFIVDNEKAYHLVRVLRKDVNDKFIVFNSVQGEYECIIKCVTSKCVSASVVSCIRQYTERAYKTAICFGLIDHSRCKWLVEKVTELDVSMIIPIKTRYSDGYWNKDKICKIVVGASEQCERIDIPEVHDIVGISDIFDVEVLERYKKYACIERDREVGSNNVDKCRNSCFIVGPSGGFSDDEIGLLKSKSDGCIDLGPNILRTETAAIKALCL